MSSRISTTGWNSPSRSSSSSTASNRRSWPAGSFGSEARSRLIVEARHERGELRPAAAAELLERRVARAHQRPQRPQQRRVRKLGVALLDRFAPQDDRVVGVALLELPYQARLADARLTAEQHQRRTPVGGLSQTRLKLRQLPDAADEVTARQSCAHD